MFFLRSIYTARGLTAHAIYRKGVYSVLLRSTAKVRTAAPYLPQGVYRLTILRQKGGQAFPTAKGQTAVISYSLYRPVQP